MPLFLFFKYLLTIKLVPYLNFDCFGRLNLTSNFRLLASWENISPFLEGHAPMVSYSFLFIAVGSSYLQVLRPCRCTIPKSHFFAVTLEQLVSIPYVKANNDHIHQCVLVDYLGLMTNLCHSRSFPLSLNPNLRKKLVCLNCIKF